MGIEALDPFELPLINTIILLASGFTVTYGHHFLINGKRGKTLYGLLYTIILAVIFTGLQGVEYSVSSFTISDGAFGSCFYFATGFHGLHSSSYWDRKSSVKKYNSSRSFFTFTSRNNKNLLPLGPPDFPIRSLIYYRICRCRRLFFY